MPNEYDEYKGRERAQMYDDCRSHETKAHSFSMEAVRYPYRGSGYAFLT